MSLPRGGAVAGSLGQAAVVSALDALSIHPARTFGRDVVSLWGRRPEPW